MSRFILVGRLTVRDLQRRPAQAVLLLLAITAATTVLSLALALHGVTNQPYQQTTGSDQGPGRGRPAGRPGAGWCTCLATRRRTLECRRCSRSGPRPGR